MAEPIEYVDVSGLDRVYRRATARLGDHVLFDASRESPIPEECMEKLADFIGDGQSSVTVGGEVAINDFGNKASAYVSVRVACGTDERSIDGAHAVACEIKEVFLQSDFDAMASMLEDKLAAKAGMKAMEKEPEAARPAVPAKARASTPRPAGKPTPVNRRR